MEKINVLYLGSLTDFFEYYLGALKNEAEFNLHASNEQNWNVGRLPEGFNPDVIILDLCRQDFWDTLLKIKRISPAISKKIIYLGFLSRLEIERHGHLFPPLRFYLPNTQTNADHLVRLVKESQE